MWAYMKGLTAERGIDVNAGIEKQFSWQQITQKMRAKSVGLKKK